MKKVFILVSLGIFVSLISCQEKKEKQEEEITFLVTSPVRMDTTITKKYVSQIRSIQHIELKALERGYLQKIFVDEGDFVKKGQLLFKVMPRLYEAEVQKAEAEVKFAEIEYQNTKKLADSNIVASNELAMAKAKVDKAKAELGLAQAHLAFTDVKAPFDGIIDRFHVRQGSLLEEGELLTELSDNSKMWVYYNVPEAEYLDYQSSVHSDELMQVNLLMANNKVFESPGIVETIEADFNNETGNIPFRATFPNTHQLLRHGQTGTVQMVTPLNDVLLIPQKATFEILDKRYVYVIDEDNMIKSRAITIAQELPHIFVVKDGLKENDKILLEGLRLVREDDEIHYDFVEPLTAIANLNLRAE